MSKTRLFVVISLVVSAFVPLQSVTAVDIPDEQFSLNESWAAEHPAGTGDQSVGVWFNDFGFNAVASSSFLVDESNAGSVICPSIDACPKATKFFAMSMLHFCSDKTEINCIVSAHANDLAGKRIEYTNRRYVPADQENVFPGDASYRLPQGSTASLGTFQGVKNLGGNENYTVAAYVIQRFTITDRTTKSVQSADPLFLANITGINLETGNYSPRKLLQKEPVYGNPSIDYENSVKNNDCVILDINLCGKPVALPSDVSFGLRLRMNTQFYGWLHGRLSNATFTQISSTDKYSEFEISGQGSKIPSALAKTTLSQMSEEEWAGVIGGGGKPSPTTYGSWAPYLNIVASVRGTYMMNSFNLMQKYMNEKAVSMPTFWSVRNVESGQVTNASGQRGLDCLYKFGGNSGKILGFVNTNATAYTSGPPTFNESEGALEYRVAAPHFAKDGSEFKGMYSLQIDSNVARCMFGTVGSAVKATVTVVNKDGQNSVSTATVNESNGMFKFLAAGFTFSSPTIRVKIENAPVVTPTPTPAPIATKSSIVSKKITCIKGKTVKTVSGVNPKCPTGFKKK